MDTANWKRTVEAKIKNLETKYDVNPSTGCWIWNKRVNNSGYGSAWFNGKNHPAHRASWMHHNGEILNGLWVLHKCDVRPCINPEHLFLGTQQDNIRDMHAKGRGCTKNNHYTRKRLAAGILYANVASQTALTKDKVILIKRAHAAGIPIRLLGRALDCAQQTIQAVVRGETWKHVTI